MKKKIFVISSSIIFVENFMYDLLDKISDHYHITLITNMKNSKIKKRPKINYINTKLHRKISIISDIKNIFKIINLHRIYKPDLIITCTPKSIIIGIILVLLFRTTKIHFYTGIFWSRFNFTLKLIFSLMDRVNIFTSKKIFFDSNAQINFFKKYRIRSNKFKLIANGSMKGVNTNLFKPNNLLKNEFKDINKLDKESVNILFLGRINLDKGIIELIKVFKKLKKNNKNINLFIYGHDEINIKNLISNIYPDNHCVYINNYTNEPHYIFPCFDIFVLPSKREGFGNSVIEASSCEVPSLTSDIYGLEDSSLNGINSIKYSLDNMQDFEIKFQNLIDDKGLRKNLGKNGRYFVKKNFESSFVITFLEDQISTILNE